MQCHTSADAYYTFNEQRPPAILVCHTEGHVCGQVVDDASDNGGCQGGSLALPQAHKQLWGVEDDGVDARPLLEEGAGSCQDQLGPVLAGDNGLPGVLDLQDFQRKTFHMQWGAADEGWHV